ncbi:MAG: hypothetical protein QG635_893 [Bacteroidota bacterium]|nr:hypothetical protein [Bacteroidota bacterium]
MKTITILVLISVAAMLSSCGITRTVTDIYTITQIDTTSNYQQKNAPGNRDNGVIYPSSRTILTERNMIQRDSVVERYYPDFIRLGIFESVGLLFGGNHDYALGGGVFGCYPSFRIDPSIDSGSSSNVFAGGIYRLGIGEWRLRWFRDAKNWTYGLGGIEAILPDARIERALITILPAYIRKRYFLREEIPYICLTGAVGIGWWPSKYINISASLDLGSVGGLNLRAYLGLAAGTNSSTTPQVRMSERTLEDNKIIFPYGGLGISVLDFLNLVPETTKEWKEHEHSSWDVGLVQFAFLSTSSDYDIFSSGNDKTVFNGFLLKLCNAAVALPLPPLNNRLYVGTSLINAIALGKREYGIGILPIRIGFWQTVLADELTTEPFVEYNYYPSSFYHIGNRLNFRVSSMFNVSVILGYAAGNTFEGIGNRITDDLELGLPGDFSGGYIGISMGLFDRIFFPEYLRYNE